MEEKYFECRREQFKICGREYLPEAREQGEKLHAVILSHGFGSNMDEMAVYGRGLAERGYAAYCFDFCGGSRPGTGKSGGTTLEMTIGSECEDLIQVINMVQALDYIDSRHISLLGASQGGFISALTAAGGEVEIEKLILLFPAFCIPDHARRGCLGGASYQADAVPQVIECPNQMKLSKSFQEQAAGMDVFEEIIKYQGPVLLLHGMKDTVVDYSYAVSAQSAYGKEQCSLLLLRDAGHGFDSQQDEMALTAAEKFLAGQKELLTVQVFITGSENVEEASAYKRTAVSFTGYCDNDLFRGCIIPEGVDMQTKCENEPTFLRAEYELLGTDCRGQVCHIHIINQKKGDQYKPELKTDSEALGFLEERDLTATLEAFPEGVTVRIFG